MSARVFTDIRETVSAVDGTLPTRRPVRRPIDIQKTVRRARLTYEYFEKQKKGLRFRIYRNELNVHAGAPVSDVLEYYRVDKSIRTDRVSRFIVLWSAFNNPGRFVTNGFPTVFWPRFWKTDRHDASPVIRRLSTPTANR